MKNSSLPRIDINPKLHERLLRYCRLQRGDCWTDPEGRHRIGCLDAASPEDVSVLMGKEKADLAIQDPPYNLIAFGNQSIEEYIAWCEKWIAVTGQCLKKDSSLYIWLGADQTRGFQPLPDFMLMMRKTDFEARSFITMRNQRGYGTQKNWMAVRQELLYYTKGKPRFAINAEYTEIPRILRGYYKEINGTLTENAERSKSGTIRAGNVWVDIQQVFYRMEENVNGCYVQKPLKSCERIIEASSPQRGLVIDFFAHSGSTVLAAELAGRRCFTADIDPVFCEIVIRRLEHFRTTGKRGWQNGNPFETELAEDPALRRLVRQGLNGGK